MPRKSTPAPPKPPTPATKPKRRSPTPRPRRTHPGPTPAIMVGFMPKALRWGPRSPTGQVLGYLAAGATWDLAARAAHLHPATPRTWNARGQDALGEHPDLTTAAQAARATDDPETLAYLVFHVHAEAARGAPVLNALGQIIRAGGKDWRAAAHTLRVLPQANDYREVSRHEVTGEDGGAVRLDITEAAERTILDLADQFSDDDPPNP